MNLSIRIGDLRAIARFNGYHDALDFARELSKRIDVDVHYSRKVLEFRNGQYVRTLRIVRR